MSVRQHKVILIARWLFYHKVAVIEQPTCAGEDNFVRLRSFIEVSGFSLNAIA